MKVLIDTNIILDIFQRREPFFSSSYSAMRKVIESNAGCLISASAVTDIFYILRKSLKSSKQAKEQIEKLSKLADFADVQGIDIQAALMREMPDFEDAVVDAVAERHEVDYILTRNIKDFTGSVVPAIEPEDFLGK